jgi:hypothetical protein
MGTGAEIPLAHRLERNHLLDAIWIEVLELQPILEQHPADEPTGGDGEVALVEGHERHHIPLGGHGLIAGNPPLDGVYKWRKLARLDKTEELLTGNIEHV